MPGRRRRARAVRHRPRTTSASSCSGSCDYLLGGAVLVRDRARRRGRVAADPGEPRRDGRGLGALRGVGRGPDRRCRQRARLRLRQVVARRPARDHDAAARPVLPRAAVADDGRHSPRCRRDAYLEASGRDRARPRRGRGAQPAQRRSRTRTRSSPATRRVDDAARPTGHRIAPLRDADIPPITDGAAAIVIAAGDRRHGQCASGRPGSGRSTTASRRTRSGVRDLATSASTRPAGEAAPASPTAGSTSPSCTRSSATRSSILRDALGLADDVDVNPSGGALAANPVMAAGLVRIGEVAHRIIERRRRPRRRPRDVRARACNRTSSCVLEGE